MVISIISIRETSAIPVLVDVTVLALAAGSILWTAIKMVYPQGVADLRLKDKPLPFAHLAPAVGLAALGAMAAVNVSFDLLGLEHKAIAPLGWCALVAMAAAMTLLLWDRAAKLPLLGLYVSGLVAIAMQWDYWQDAPRMLCLRAGSDLAGFVLITAIAGWLLPKAHSIWRRIRIPAKPDRFPDRWFMLFQAFVFSVACALAIWTALDFGFDGLAKGVALFGLSGRLIGSMGVLMALGGAIVMAWQARPTWRFSWQCASFIAGMLYLSSLRWAGIDPAQAGPWLHRSVVFLVSSAMMTLLCSFGLKKVISAKSDWIGVGQRMAPLFGGATILTLGLVLAQKWLLYQNKIGTPMAGTEIIAVALIVAAMLAACLAKIMS